MDRFAEQLFGGPDKQSRSRAAEGASFMATMAKSFASSAAKRAMESKGGRHSRGAFEAEDFHKLGGFVLEMMSGGNEGERRRKKRRHRDRERGRGRERERDMDRGMPREPERTREEAVYGSEKRKRRHRSSGSPLHVTFAEPLQDYDYPPPRKRHHRRRHHHHEEAAPAPESRRRPRRHGPPIDLRSLRTELEDMSHTIIGLNARSTSHRDCEFYDKFARKGGKLQDVIGSTLGQLRGMEESGGYEEEERRERKRRRRERRSR